MTRSLIAATLALGLAVPAAADEIADWLESTGGLYLD